MTVIAIVASEPSADILGAALINELKKTHPSAFFIGVTGPLMEKAGCKSILNLEEISVMGIVAIVANLKRLLKLRHMVTEFMKQLNPDIYIGIDGPDFNLPIEEQLKKAHIKTAHYISPSVWAWRQKRIYRIKRSIDLMLSILPFEESIYTTHQIPYQFIGHTLADQIPLEVNKEQAKQELGISGTTLAILPGSRDSEINLMWPIFCKTAQQLMHQKQFTSKIIVPYVKASQLATLQKIAQEYKLTDIIFLERNTSLALRAADVALVTSGTATFEAMLYKTPTVVGYRMSFLTYQIAKRLVKTKYIALPNLVADKLLFQEFIQHACTAENLGQALVQALQNKTAIEQECYTIHEKISLNASHKAAQCIDVLLANKSQQSNLTTPSHA